MYSRIALFGLAALLLIGGGYVLINQPGASPILNNGVPLIDNEDNKDTPLPLEKEEGEGEGENTGDSRKTYRNANLGLSFVYESGENGYHLQSEISAADAAKMTRIILTPMDDYRELQQATAPREGPPTITVSVYPNTAREGASAWATNHPAFSNSNLALGAISETVVGGANAVRYTADGLYPTDTVVVAHGSFVYVISGSYLDESSETRVDFEPFLKSIAFIPEA